MQKLISHNRELKVKHSQEFLHTFNVSLFKFMHPLFGFDVINFDKWLQTPDGISTSDYLKQEYNERAESLITELLQ